MPYSDQNTISIARYHEAISKLTKEEHSFLHNFFDHEGWKTSELLIFTEQIAAKLSIEEAISVVWVIRSSKWTGKDIKEFVTRVGKFSETLDDPNLSKMLFFDFLISPEARKGITWLNYTTELAKLLLD